MSLGKRVFVGNLPEDVRTEELDHIFGKYGQYDRIDIKGGREPGQPRFAFIEFSDDRDASDACYREDGMELAGCKLRVEIARGGRERDRDRFDDRGPPRGGGYGDEPRGRPRYDRNDDAPPRMGLGPSPYGPSRKTDYAVEISGLDPAMSWQDLKDHFRDNRLEVTHADVDRRGYGTVMFASPQDMDDAIRTLDGVDMRNARGSCQLRLRPMASRGRSPGGYRDDYRERDRYY